MTCARTWCFTWNNPPGLDSTSNLIQFDWTVFGDSLRYGVAQLERGESGTIHWQGYVEFTKPRKLGGLKKAIAAAHFEQRRGTPTQAREYCMKPEGRVSGPFEFGNFKDGGQGKRTDLVSAMSMVKDGKTDQEVAEEMPAVWLRYSRGLREYKRICLPPRTFKTEVFVYWGPTGTGKTRRAFEEHPGAYFKPRGDWWDGYEGQTCVVIDDFSGWLPYTFMLHLLDRYPLLVPYKGGFHQFSSRTVIITSNFHPSAWYNDKVKCPDGPLLRRLDSIVEFAPTPESLEELGNLDDLNSQEIRELIL